MEIRTEILIIGGGATGAGIARDLSIRGVPCILVEKGDLASGASGRNQGLLHSGGRYAVSDPHTARECISENRVLRAIAPHLIEETGGLFVSLPEDGLGFQGEFLDGCRSAEIETSVLTPAEALEREPNLTPDLLGAIEVPDGVIDPFGLVLANVRDAEHHGARFFFHTEVFSVGLSRGWLGKVFAKDSVSGEEYSIVPSYVMNATGAWANQFLRLAGIRTSLALSKGSMLITNRRLTRAVINRCRPASDGDIIAPNDTVSILGTTSVGSQDAADFDVTGEEVSQIIAETAKMVPEIAGARFIRAYAGVRPLFRVATETGEESDRGVSRGFALIDHGARNEVSNLITVIGGKLVTYRLMAEKAVDLVCGKIGVATPCSTHLRTLPDLEEEPGPPGLMPHAHGQEYAFRGTVICDCELVSRDQIEKQIGHKKMRAFTDVLHRTRLAKGTCQGGFCAYRLMAMLDEKHAVEGDSREVLEGFLEERWKGIRPILWGTAVKEAELIETIYKDVLNFHTPGVEPGA
jgi:glycerol-3-phosphate dehydrogenase